MEPGPLLRMILIFSSASVIMRSLVPYELEGDSWKVYDIEHATMREVTE